ncbi:MAG TPA: MBL fold metallo-hydrolase [Chloroflexia bacterium]|nr:MBL fold metallo-hydrolase [Chloroflexia bacterium]
MKKNNTLNLENSKQQPDFKTGSLFFIGTATVLLRYAGFTILTDPNFLHRHDVAKLGYGLRSTRLTEPAMQIEDLPPVELIVLSHMHEDHFDRIAIARLDKNIPILSTPQAVAVLKNKGFQAAHDLTTWDSFTLRKGEAWLRVTSMPGRHGPGILTVALPQVMGSLLEFGRGSEEVLFRLYITGDTLFNNDLREIPERYPDINLALLHLGGTRIFGLMLTMDGRQGVETLKLIAPDMAIPVHYNDYTVFKSPLEDFKRYVQAAGLEKRVHYLAHGETYTFKVASGRAAKAS